MAQIAYIQVTRKCNQRCIICSSPPTDRFLSFQKAKKQINELISKGYKEIVLTGGEPTLYPYLPDLINYCVKKKILPRIITNGQLISDFDYLKKIKRAGLKHLHLSIYSHKKKVQEKITQNKESLKNIKKALNNLKKISDIKTDINITINKYNADHLSETVSWLLEKYNFIKHFVFNNLDPFRNRASQNPQTIPRLNDFESELHKSLKILEKNGKTFRVERVPLCYLSEYEHVSTETRKIVKKEDRIIYFLDKRGRFKQNQWFYKKARCCNVCFLKNICAGLYHRGGYYDEKELYPVFVPKEKIIKKIIFNN